MKQQIIITGKDYDEFILLKENMFKNIYSDKTEFTTLIFNIGMLFGLIYKCTKDRE